MGEPNAYEVLSEAMIPDGGWLSVEAGTEEAPLPLGVRSNGGLALVVRSVGGESGKVVVLEVQYETVIRAGGKTLLEWRIGKRDVKAAFKGGSKVELIGPQSSKVVWVAENRVVNVCEVADPYLYGFNGQEEIDEIAGV